MQSYGLKVNTKYNLTDYQEKIMTTAGDVVLFEPGVYKIYCDGDIFVKHNIVDELMHITCISIRDNIKINIECAGEVEKNVSDVYHEVIVKNKNIIVNIKAKGVVDGNSKVIYRSKISNYEKELNINSLEKDVLMGSGIGNQKAEFLKMSDLSEVDAEPSLDITGDDFKCSHSFSVTHINEEKKNYLALHGYEEKEIEKEIKESFLS